MIVEFDFEPGEWATYAWINRRVYVERCLYDGDISYTIRWMNNVGTIEYACVNDYELKKLT